MEGVAIIFLKNILFYKKNMMAGWKEFTKIVIKNFNKYINC